MTAPTRTTHKNRLVSYSYAKSAKNRLDVEIWSRDNNEEWAKIYCTRNGERKMIYEGKFDDIWNGNITISTTPIEAVEP